MANDFFNQEIEIKKESLYKLVADRLEQMILENQMEEGERLPSEPELAESFGVSRNVLREALKVLNERNLIIQKNGDGTFIAKPDSKNVTAVLNRIVLTNNIGYSDIYEMRLILEPPVCLKIAETISGDTIAELRELIQAMRESDNDVKQRSEYDLMFHHKIIDQADNPLLSCVYDAVLDLFRPIIEKGLSNDWSGHMDGIIWHTRIVDALEKHEGENAALFMRQHLEKSEILCR